MTTHLLDKQSISDMHDKYHRAQILMNGIWAKKLALNASVIPTWIAESNCFWYEREEISGRSFRLVDANHLSNEPAFDHDIFANALAKAAKRDIDPDDLPIDRVTISIDPRTINFSAFDREWLFDEISAVCTPIKSLPKNWVVSPDGRFAVFSRDFNLWLRDLKLGKESALTFDGEQYYCYGAVGTAWGTAVTPPNELQAHWSPDSKKIFTVQRDTRLVKSTPLVQHLPEDGSVRPLVDHVRVAYPGDENLETIRLLVVDIEISEVIEPDYGEIPVTRNGFGFFSSGLGWWAGNSSKVYFVDVSADYKNVKVVEFDFYKRKTKVLFEESTSTHINLSPNADELPTFLPIIETSELLWFSERSGWGHLYLYDLKTGNLKSSVTMGDWLVRNIVFFEAKRREVFIQTAGRVAQRDPYYRDLARVNIDTGEITTLVSSDHEYTAIAPQSHNTMLLSNVRDVNDFACSVSYSGDYFVITRSRADEIPTTFLSNRNGELLLEIEKADTGALLSAFPNGFHWPEPFKVMSADGKTDIYGLIFRPSDFDPKNSYPVIDFTNNSPDFPLVPKGSFSNGTVLDWVYLSGAALAELGFIVVQIDGRGTSYRSKKFQDQSYGKINYVNNLEDHVVGIQQLAARYRYIDLDRVGITTHASDGSGAVLGLLQYPEFYKVGIGFSTLDSRLMSSAMWSNKNGGVSGQDSEHQYLEDMAHHLQGKLLLMHGMLNQLCPPAGVFRLIDALQKANKDFDLILLPNVTNEPNSYLIRRAFDYLVAHLLKVDPPREFQLTSIFD